MVSKRSLRVLSSSIRSEIFSRRLLFMCGVPFF
nr:MAG TPA: hypothetical protein [Caudoviricetes sp.]